MICKSITELVGGTPLIELCGYEAALGLNARIIGKAEYFNPAGSVKDRIAAAMIDDAEKNGRLKPHGAIIEPTSGNTGIALAAVAAAKGYKAIIVMPETMSVERRNIMQMYGAEIVLTEGSKGMKGAIEKAEELLRTTDGSVMLGQFTNPINPKAHEVATGPEIWHDTDGNVDILVAGVGTGGTISGAGKYLKSKNAKIRIVAVEPKDSPVLSEGRAGTHKIQGIGAGFVPQTLDTSVYDDVVTVTNDDSFSAAKLLAKTDGLLVGISSGAALSAATMLARCSENARKNIVVILPDSADRYYSTKLFM